MTLLIIDDTPDVVRAMKRVLSGSFHQILVASLPEDAERLLSDRDDSPTHLVCDQHFGAGQPLGSDLIPRWRRTYPHLQVAVLLTGSEILALAPIEGIDSIATKPIDAHELLELLLGDRADR